MKWTKIIHTKKVGWPDKPSIVDLRVTHVFGGLNSFEVSFLCSRHVRPPATNWGKQVIFFFVYEIDDLWEIFILVTRQIMIVEE